MVLGESKYDILLSKSDIFERNMILQNIQMNVKITRLNNYSLLHYALCYKLKPLEIYPSPFSVKPWFLSTVHRWKKHWAQQTSFCFLSLWKKPERSYWSNSLLLSHNLFLWETSSYHLSFRSKTLPRWRKNRRNDMASISWRTPEIGKKLSQWNIQHLRHIKLLEFVR